MKTFKQLTVGDEFYIVYSGSTKYQTEVVKEVYEEKFRYQPSETMLRFDKPSAELPKNYYNNHRYATVDKSKAIRFCKAQLMKELNLLISAAKKSISEVSKFKLEHFELLNHDWTEKQINILEDQENSL